MTADDRYRLDSLIYGAIAIPVGLIIYGWTAQERVHPAVPIVATGLVGFGVMFTFVRRALQISGSQADLKRSHLMCI